MIYFISDTHLGLEFQNSNPIEREKILIKFLDQITPQAKELFLVGDIFDFWFEWNHVIPKYYCRTIAKLAQMVDEGVVIHFFTGNHDLWIEDYLHSYAGLTIHKEPLLINRNGKQLFITHGDTLYKHKGFSKFLDVTFRSRGAKWLSQRIIHPDLMARFGKGWSKSNRGKHGNITHQFLGEEDYWVKASREMLTLDRYKDVNYFVYGHLHLRLIYKLTPSCSMVVLGEWVDSPTYSVLDEDGNFQQYSF